MTDARKPLQQLHDEWWDCTKCSLGVHRRNVGGHFVFGEGAPRGILFVGEGPGRNEEREGRPFVGDSGVVLRAVIEKFGLVEYYITNVVTCRSCEPVTDATGAPIIGKSYGGKPGKPRYKDVPPNAAQVEACLPRLYEQIYILDPIVIVSLGAPAAEALTGKRVAITSEAGRERHITIPGASMRASLTEKKGAWLRKVHGQMASPVETNSVRYLLIPTLHPAYVLRQYADQRPGKNATWQFVSDIRKAVKIYERYMFEVFNKVVALHNASDEELAESIEQSQEVPENQQDYYHE